MLSQSRDKKAAGLFRKSTGKACGISHMARMYFQADW